MVCQERSTRAPSTDADVGVFSAAANGPINTHRSSNVLEALFTQIIEDEVKPANGGEYSNYGRHAGAAVEDKLNDLAVLRRPESIVYCRRLAERGASASAMKTAIGPAAAKGSSGVPIGDGGRKVEPLRACQEINAQSGDKAFGDSVVPLAVEFGRLILIAPSRHRGDNAAGYGQYRVRSAR